MIFRKRDWQDEYDQEYIRRSRRERRSSSRLQLGLHIVGLQVFGALVLIGIGVLAGQVMFERTVVLLASPVGVAWLLLMGLVYFSLLLHQRWPAITGLVVWLILTVFGNGWVADQLMYRLEAPYLNRIPIVRESETGPIDGSEVAGESPVDRSNERYDMIFLLGGGTETIGEKVAAVGSGGDRVVLAARLFHSDRAPIIVCTGKQEIRSTPNDLHPATEAKQILVGLGIPEPAIIEIGGINTADEMAKIARFLEVTELPHSRIGLVTSAWHMPRAIRLATERGLELTPLPADFHTGPFVPGPDLLVPTGDNLAVSARAIKEWLAGWVGR